MEKIKVYIIVAVLVLVGFAAFVIIGAMDDEGADNTVDTVMNGTNASDLPADAETEGNTTETPPADSATVTIQNQSFGPDKITVKKGTTVTWTNQDAMEHKVTPDSPTSGFQQGKLLARGESYSVTFDTVGSFSYFCSLHPDMRGSVEVVE